MCVLWSTHTLLHSKSILLPQPAQGYDRRRAEQARPTRAAAEPLGVTFVSPRSDSIPWFRRSFLPPAAELAAPGARASAANMARLMVKLLAAPRTRAGHGPAAARPPAVSQIQAPLGPGDQKFDSWSNCGRAAQRAKRRSPGGASGRPARPAGRGFGCPVARLPLSLLRDWLAGERGRPFAPPRPLRSSRPRARTRPPAGAGPPALASSCRRLSDPSRGR